LAIPRVGEPDEITRLVLFVASDEPASRPAPSFIADGGLCSASAELQPARVKWQITKYDSTLNRHHATKQFDLLRKMPRKGKL